MSWASAVGRPQETPDAARAGRRWWSAAAAACLAGIFPADRAEHLLGRVHEVGPGAAVNVDVDVAGGKIAALQIDDFGTRWSRRSAGLDGRDPRILDRHGAAFKQMIREEDGAAGEI